jgi:Phage tail assembly chaperone protein
MQIRTNDGKVMYEAEFRAYTLANGGPTWETTTSEVLASLGASVVLESPTPTITRYQGIARDGVEQIDGQWFTKWKIVDFDDAVKAVVDEQQAKSVREERNKKLSECDWTQVADAPVDKAVWATYRQELRDLTKQTGFPWEVTWPTQP